MKAEKNISTKRDWRNAVEDMDAAALMNKITRYIWAGLGIACMAGVIFAGAWWHLFTAAVCAIMYLAFKSEEETDNQ